MRGVKVVTRIAVSEVDGESTETMKECPEMRITNHPLRAGMVIVEGPEGAKHTVLASHLVIAIANASRDGA